MKKTFTFGKGRPRDDRGFFFIDPDEKKLKFRDVLCLRGSWEI
jgi:hypothetical protein